MTTAIQRQMDLRDARYRPAADTNAAMRDLDLTADEVIALTESGDLVGWNIAVDPTGRRELRILSASVAHYHDTLGSRPQRFTFEQMLGRVLLHTKPVIASTEVQRALNCDSGHVINLIEAGELAVVRGTDWGRGRGNVASITRASFVEFLRRRQL
jgi:hypothetical protein